MKRTRITHPNHEYYWLERQTYAYAKKGSLHAVRVTIGTIDWEKETVYVSSSKESGFVRFEYLQRSFN